MSLPDVTNLPKYLYSVTSSTCSASIITPALSLVLVTSLHMILVFFYSVSFHLSYLRFSDLRVSLHFQQTVIVEYQSVIDQQMMVNNRTCKMVNPGILRSRLSLLPEVTIPVLIENYSTSRCLSWKNHNLTCLFGCHHCRNPVDTHG